MLERETELIKQIIIESTINGREALPLSEVVGAQIPRGVKSYMLAAVMDRLEDEFKQSHTLSGITKRIGSTVVAERTVLRSLATQYVLQRSEFEKLVEDTVHFLENYLCRPQWTLVQMMFEKEERIPFETLVRKFERVVDYAYYGTLVERHARRRNMHEMDKHSFATLIARIDEEIARQHSPRELAYLTKPIFDFLLYGDSTPTRPVPVESILLFFDDKKMMGVKEYIERICHVRSRTQISIAELTGILEDLYNVETTVKEEVQESEQEILKPIEHTIEATEKAVESEPSPEPPGLESREVAELPAEESVPVSPGISEPPAVEEHADEAAAIDVTQLDTTELEKDLPEPPLPVQPVVSADELVAYAKERETQQYKTMLTFPQRPAEEKVPEELPDIHEMLTTGQRARFISTIFHDDANSSFVFFTSLNTAKTWREAQPYLRDLFEMNKLDMLSPEVVEFTDAMQARYQPELRKTE
ncbi:MAG: hypothetical protein KF749_10815 [Bacteroidetes bacterium]|nr:hypothetical protein [Bacteroidota bacterium]MCW5895638.1 hypothetical protein [Bacteroidota bacterium]